MIPGSIRARPDTSIRVVPVTNRGARAAFLDLPSAIHAADPAWVRPLRAERRQHLSPRNPYFAHAQAQFWLAYRGGRPVGRVSAQIDRLHLEHHRDATGFFGMLDAEDHPAVFQALLDTAEAWLQGHGMRRVLGPFSLSINDECGLLVEGFDTPPMVMMGHARPYYQFRLEAQAYRPAKDLLAYRVQAADIATPPFMRRALFRIAGEVRTRPLSRKRFAADLEILREIFQDAWAHNWGFQPFTAAEFARLGRLLRFLVDDEMVQIAELGGRPVGMIVVLPNVNEAMRGLNGRLLPLGWLRLLWRLRVRGLRTARVALMGVRQEVQHGPLGAALAFRLIDAVRTPGLERGIEEVELSWILEDNLSMRRILEAIGSTPYKRYRIYEKDLA